MTIKQLIELDWKHKCSQSSMPPHAVPRTKFNEKNANGLTKAIVAYVTLTGHHAVRVNNTGIYRPGRTIDKGTDIFMNKGTWTPGSRKGIADIDATKKITINGRDIGVKVAIEVKFGKDRMSVHQKEIKQEIEDSGGFYIIARTFEQFVNEWQSIS